MYGYIRFYADELKMKDFHLFKAYYCGLCRELKKQYGQRGRMLLSYDMTFMAIFLDSLEEKPPQQDRGNCPISPLKKKPMIISTNGLKKAASLSMLMGYYKLEDAWQDDRSLWAKTAMWVYKKPFQRCENKDPLLAKLSTEKLQAFYKGEQENPKDLDVLTHPFGALVGEFLSTNIPDQNQTQDYYKMGYHAGRWLYFIDALDDLPKDIETGQFNAFTATLPYPSPTWQDFYNQAKDDIYANLFVSLDEITRVLETFDIKHHKELIENIFFLGIRTVTQLLIERRDQGSNEKFATPFQIKTACSHDVSLEKNT